MQSNNLSANVQNAARPGLLRVFASMFYDFWLILAIWLIGITIDTMIRHTLTGSGYAGNHLLLQLYFVLSPLVFYGWFWTHGGQTLGMRSWRIRVLTHTGGPINWQQAAIRYAGSVLSLGALGFGYLWILFDADDASWHDKLSGTLLVVVKKHQ